MKTMQEAKVVNLIPPVAIVDNNSWTTTEIDTAGYSWCSIYVNLGATDIAMAALKVQESDTSGSGFADITGLNFATSPATLPSATADGLVFAVHIDLRKNRKRYLDLVATAGNGTTGTYASGLAFLYDADEIPASVSARGVSQQIIG